MFYLRFGMKRANECVPHRPGPGNISSRQHFQSWETRKTEHRAVRISGIYKIPQFLLPLKFTSRKFQNSTAPEVNVAFTNKKKFFQKVKIDKYEKSSRIFRCNWEISTWWGIDWRSFVGNQQNSTIISNGKKSLCLEELISKKNRKWKICKEFFLPMVYEKYIYQLATNVGRLESSVRLVWR